MKPTPSPYRSALTSWFGYTVALLSLSVFGMGCPSATVCKQSSDCTNAKICQEGKCVSAQTETSKEQVGTEKTSDGGSGDAGGPPEPTSLGDLKWKEGTLLPPETLQENQPLPKEGQRKAGDTCNPLSTALPVDRCEKGSVCAPTALGIAGRCLKSCDPKNANACGDSQRCVTIVSPDFREEVGSGCAPTVQTGFPCSQAQACLPGSVCMAYASSSSGICRKTCTGQPDCKGQWCYSKASVQGKNVTGCAPFVNQPDLRCPNQTVCGEGLNCFGSVGSKRCLTNCKSKPCPSTHTCRETRDSRGNVNNKLCFRNVKAGEPCDSTTVCEKNHKCVLLASSPLWARCMKDCTTETKACSAQQICDSVNSSTKVCYQIVKENQRCGGELRCDKGLVCASTHPAGGPKHCQKPCQTDSDCSAPQTCQQLTGGSKPPKICAPGCSSQSPKCAKGFACVSGVAASEICVPATTDWQGKQGAGKECLPHAVSPATLRCQPLFQCVSLAEGWRCLRPCDPKANTCPTNQTCLWDHQTKAYYCGVSAGLAKACNLTQGTLCAKGTRCLHQVTSSAGICVPHTTQKPGEACTSDFTMPCAESEICSGDSSLPFRWTCRVRCSLDGKTACPAKQTCLNTVNSAGACFEDCPSSNTCAKPQERCVSLQKKKVCM